MSKHQTECRHAQLIQPQVGEIWQLKTPYQDWNNGLVLKFVDNNEMFVTAKIIITELPKNYDGINVEIHDSFSTNVPAPFVVYINQAKNLTIDNFNFKRGKLSAADLERVLQHYIRL